MEPTGFLSWALTMVDLREGVGGGCGTERGGAASA